MRLPRLLACLLALSLPTAALAGTITDGNDPTVAGTQVDGCTNCSFILADPFAQAGATVTTYSFYAFFGWPTHNFFSPNNLNRSGAPSVRAFCGRVGTRLPEAGGQTPSRRYGFARFPPQPHSRE